MLPKHRGNLILCSLLVYMVSWAAASGVNAGLATSTFDDGTFQGWTPVHLPDAAEITVEPSGGNPGGFVHAVDTMAEGGTFWISAPAEFLGDLSGYSGLSWDERLLITDGLNRSTRAVLLGADNTTYINTVAPGDVGNWRKRFAAFDESEWEHGLSGTMTFQEVLGNVVELWINLDVNVAAVPALESDVDNITLVPEPAALVLLAAGALMLRRRCRREI